MGTNQDNSQSACESDIKLGDHRRAGSLFSTQLFSSILTKIGTPHEVRTEIFTLTLLISPVE